MLEELGRHVLVGGILARELERHLQHRDAVEGHPGRAVGLLEDATARQRPRAVEDADVVEAEEAAAEEVVALAVLAVHPPGKVEAHLLEDALQEQPVAPAARPRHLVDAPGGPGVHRRVHVGERELVGRQLPVGVHVPLAREEHELFLGEGGIDAREGDHVEREVPGGVPGIFPGVGQRQHVAVVEMPPVGVAAAAAARGWRWLRRVAVEPVLDDVVEELP